MASKVKSDGVRAASPVDPIKDLDKVVEIATKLKETNPRNCAIFVMGINVGLRAGDLLDLKLSDVLDGDKFRNAVVIVEEKTGKRRDFTLNAAAKAALDYYLASSMAPRAIEGEETYLFPSRVGTNQPLSVKALHKLVNKWCLEAKLTGNFGTHTLRKTFAYHLYTKHIASNPRILDVLQMILGHSSTTVTLRYIGVTAQEIDGIYSGLNLGI